MNQLTIESMFKLLDTNDLFVCVDVCQDWRIIGNHILNKRTSMRQIGAIACQKLKKLYPEFKLKAVFEASLIIPQHGIIFSLYYHCDDVNQRLVYSYVIETTDKKHHQFLLFNEHRRGTTPYKLMSTDQVFPEYDPSTKVVKIKSLEHDIVKTFYIESFRFGPSLTNNNCADVNDAKQILFHHELYSQINESPITLVTDKFTLTLTHQNDSSSLLSINDESKYNIVAKDVMQLGDKWMLTLCKNNGMMKKYQYILVTLNQIHEILSSDSKDDVFYDASANQVKFYDFYYMNHRHCWLKIHTIDLSAYE